MATSRSLSVRSNDRDKKEKDTQGIKCHECFGFRHNQVLFPKCMWSKRKAMKATLEKRISMASFTSLRSGGGSCVVDPCDLSESFQDDLFYEEEALFVKKFGKFLTLIRVLARTLH
jgi:4-diphosphocytidyl-2C-methyl-D-erythritol kinase